MKLLIAIPALNEEQSIRSTIHRCLEAAPAILENSPVTGVEVTVISDGSTDRTVERAREFGSLINLIEFTHNQGYGAALLSAFSSKSVQDTASGMRVVRRSALEHLYPLPSGLHFTPAMSARAMLSDATRIIEVDMSYAEREGESKLRVIRDGFRFLRVILGNALLYKPGRILGLAGVLSMLAGSLLLLSPLGHCLRREGSRTG